MELLQLGKDVFLTWAWIDMKNGECCSVLGHLDAFQGNIVILHRYLMSGKPAEVQILYPSLYQIHVEHLGMKYTLPKDKTKVSISKTQIPE